MNDRIAEMKAMVAKYTSDLPDLLPVQRRKKSGIHVVLTGSTGTLGTHLLDALMSDHCVKKIICFNRSPNARDRHIENLKLRGLDLKYNFEPERIYFNASHLLSTDPASKV